ncbi:conserved hypothetical protein [Candida dubliniensis CD36]|uniref:Uncharacterized protein n=1 Tax=Candida dubliniensis (strain CD36 / ATCC MYA-646 / CBS 7987 / NCPF 3949 / NRRL Y-17841) TaxID=573826 RepID=B9WM44_CANDC|nr:conserved hypothetical protein [Candida dubliniensis CD36]CAX40157.1 conserved hypothetical protein [Candida dubliniensis CD36]
METTFLQRKTEKRIAKERTSRKKKTDRKNGKKKLVMGGNCFCREQLHNHSNTSLPLRDHINPILVMSDTEEIPVIEQEELDNPLRIILVIDHPENKESNEMEERLLDSIQSFKQMDQFFDKFDETIAIPNESHIKYEVGSDGLVVIIVDNLKLRDEVLVFIDGYNEGNENNTTENEDESQDKKKLKKEKN